MLHSVTKREPIHSKTIWKETDKKQKSFKDYDPPRTQACPFAHCKQNQNQNMHRWRNLFFLLWWKQEIPWINPDGSSIAGTTWISPWRRRLHGRGELFPSMEQWSFSLCRGVKPRLATWRCSCQHLSWGRVLVCETLSTRQPCRGDSRRLGGIVASVSLFYVLKLK